MGLLSNEHATYLHVTRLSTEKAARFPAVFHEFIFWFIYERLGFACLMR